MYGEGLCSRAPSLLWDFVYTDSIGRCVLCVVFTHNVLHYYITCYWHYGIETHAGFTHYPRFHVVSVVSSSL